MKKRKECTFTNSIYQNKKLSLQKENFELGWCSNLYLTFSRGTFRFMLECLSFFRLRVHFLKRIMRT